MPKYELRTNSKTGEVFNAKVLTLKERNAKYVAELKTGIKHFIGEDGIVRPYTDENGNTKPLEKNQKSYRAGYMASNKASQASYRFKNPNYVRKTGK